MSAKLERNVVLDKSELGRSDVLREPVVGMSSWRLAVKHTLDMIVSIIGIPVLLPVCTLAVIAIKLESRGPVLFAQTRIGKSGKPFRMYKFRSMYEDADRMRTTLEPLNEATGPVFKIKDDPRVTRVGRILRHASIDEIPQIINVLKGDMSLVGPRPALPSEVEKYGVHEMARLLVKPGLTCLWQVQGRSNISFERWVEFDLQYIKEQSLWLDLKILLKTIPAVIRGSGAW